MPPLIGRVIIGCTTSTPRQTPIRTMQRVAFSFRTSVGYCVASIPTSLPRASKLICQTSRPIRCCDSKRSTTWNWCQSVVSCYRPLCRCCAGVRLSALPGLSAPCSATPLCLMLPGSSIRRRTSGATSRMTSKFVTSSLKQNPTIFITAPPSGISLKFNRFKNLLLCHFMKK